MIPLSSFGSGAQALAGRASGAYAVGFLMLAFVLGTVLSIAAVALEELSFHRYPKTRDLATLIWLGVVENFGYRQLTIVWRMGGTLSALRGKHGWGRMDRQGFDRRIG